MKVLALIVLVLIIGLLFRFNNWHKKGGCILQAKFSIKESQTDFLNNFKTYGFKNKSSMVRTAIEHFKDILELERLKKSAELYSEIYLKDDNLKKITETAITGWPE